MWELDSFEQVVIELFSVVVFLHVHHLGVAQYFPHLRSFLLVVGHQLRDKSAKLFAIGIAYLLVLPHHDFFEQFIGSIGAEGRSQHRHFVKHASK